MQAVPLLSGATQGTIDGARFLLCVVVAGLTSVRVLAQNETRNQSKQDDSNNSKGEVRITTGCITKSEGGNEDLLTGNDGGTREIHQNYSVDPASPVNQTDNLRGVLQVLHL